MWFRDGAGCVGRCLDLIFSNLYDPTVLQSFEAGLGNGCWIHVGLGFRWALWLLNCYHHSWGAHLACPALLEPMAPLPLASAAVTGQQRDPGSPKRCMAFL